MSQECELLMSGGGEGEWERKRGSERGREGRGGKEGAKGKEGRTGGSLNLYPSVTWATYLGGFKRDQIGGAAGQEVQGLARCLSWGRVHCHQVIAVHNKRKK